MIIFYKNCSRIGSFIDCQIECLKTDQKEERSSSEYDILVPACFNSTKTWTIVSIRASICDKDGNPTKIGVEFGDDISIRTERGPINILEKHIKFGFNIGESFSMQLCTREKTVSQREIMRFEFIGEMGDIEYISDTFLILSKPSSKYHDFPFAKAVEEVGSEHKWFLKPNFSLIPLKPTETIQPIRFLQLGDYRHKKRHRCKECEDYKENITNLQSMVEDLKSKIKDDEKIKDGLLIALKHFKPS